MTLCGIDRRFEVGRFSEMANKEILRQYFFVRVELGDPSSEGLNLTLINAVMCPSK
jgi:hypothetical protein